MRKIVDFTFTLSTYDAPLLEYALEKQIQRVKNELKILEIAKVRDLHKQEQLLLPINMHNLNREEIREQIDPWISLLSDYQSLLSEIRTKKEEALKQ